MQFAFAAVAFGLHAAAGDITIQGDANVIGFSYTIGGDDPVPVNGNSVEIPKATVTAAPTAAGPLFYTGAAQTLINVGTASGGEMQYRLGDGEWSASLPTAPRGSGSNCSFRIIP